MWSTKMFVIIFLLCGCVTVDALVRYQKPEGKFAGKPKSPSHMHDMHGMTGQQQKQTIRDIQAFIANSAPEEFATLVLMGDSTMSGLVTELLNVTAEVQDNLDIIYVSNDRPEPVRYGCNEDCGGVPSHGEWKDETRLTNEFRKLTVERAEASTKALHASDCNSGGGLETYAFRDGPYKNLIVHHWGFLPEYAQFCWLPCMREAMEALKPTAVVWNVGFHLLNHDFNKVVCKQRHNPASPGCSDHKQMVKTATQDMLEVGVSQVIWKHTNWVCEDRQKEGFPKTAEALEKWHDEAALPSLEEQCAEDCPDYAGMKCYEWFFDAHTSTRMYTESSDALRELREEWGGDRVLELDAYNPTRECCDAGCEDETDDGEHYAGLDGSFAVRLASILSGSNSDETSGSEDGAGEGDDNRKGTSKNSERKRSRSHGHRNNKRSNQK